MIKQYIQNIKDWLALGNRTLVLVGNDPVYEEYGKIDIVSFPYAMQHQYESKSHEPLESHQVHSKSPQPSCLASN